MALESCKWQLLWVAASSAIQGAVVRVREKWSA
jgi:hypothetical protein